MTITKPLKIGVVGVCASGKSTLTAQLKALGYEVRHIAQEHSYVKDMWKRITNPDVLIYLDVSYPVTLARRTFDWQEKDYHEQVSRLSHARQHADLHIDTDALSPDQVLAQVLAFIGHGNP